MSDGADRDLVDRADLWQEAAERLAKHVAWCQEVAAQALEMLDRGEDVREPLGAIKFIGADGLSEADIARGQELAAKYGWTVTTQEAQEES